MAALGGFGNSPQHINEQLMNKYLLHKFAPQPYSCKLPFRVRDGTRQLVKLLDCLIFLPTDWVATGMKTSKGTSIFGTGDIESFWREQLRNDPKFAGSTLLSNDQFCTTAIPLLVHGDGGAFAERDSLLVFSMKSILSTDSVGDAQLLLAVIPKSCRVCGSGDDIGADSDTVVALWNVLAWNFTALFAGKHPELDHIGQPWPTGSERAKLAGKSLTPGGTRGFIHVLAGDMDYFSNEMGLNHHGATEPCFRCKCNKTNCPFTDFREDAAWEATKLSPADFRALAARITHAVLLLILSIPGVNFFTFHFDVLHIIDLGVAQHILGNVLFDLVHNELVGTIPNRIAELWGLIVSAYDILGTDSRHKIKPIKREHFCDPQAPHKSFPLLHSSAIKGKECRYLVDALLVICQSRQANDHQKTRFLAVQKLSNVHRLMESSSYFLAPADARELQTSMRHFLLLYNKLAKEAMQAGVMMWSIVPKHHYCVHLAEQAVFLNPRFAWCYSSETMIGRITALAASCLAGTPSHLVPSKVIQKYGIAMDIRFTYSFS